MRIKTPNIIERMEAAERIEKMIASLPPATGSARTPDDALRIELYNAAVAYAGYITGESSDYDQAMAVAQRLEDAADAFAERAQNACVSHAGADAHK